MSESGLVVYFKAFIIAVIEGLTEFIPVSSTGHMILLGDVIAFTGEKAAAFEIFIQLGAILAVVVIYKDKFIGLIPHGGSKEGFIKGFMFGDSKPTVTHILLAILPILIGGFLLHKIIKTHLFSPLTVAMGLIIGGGLMVLVERLPLSAKTETLERITWKQALIIGLGQCLALWPGMSRSGSTMITGLILGIRHKAAADFSFIIAVPVMFAAVCYDLLKSWNFLELEDFGYFIMGFVVAFFVAWGSIKWFLSVLTKLKLTPFGLYRILLGGLTLYLIG
ncbi:MAG: undecaprenyl-diphosphate phosphatase [Deltaproteobacteria bacterium]|nr:undecaprenyl-diphosphate phosphatase [Deltaproteobacteria bacterium]